MRPYPVAMTIAGSDSGGGAGIEADLRTFNAFGVYGCCAVTAVTAQNPFAVTGIFPVSGEMVARQIETVLDKIKVGAFKSGMLAEADVVSRTAAVLKKYPELPLIADPVMVSTSNCPLLAEDALEVMKKEFLPLADMITPNIPEAELLLSAKLENEKEFAAAAEELGRRFACDCLLKSGHFDAGNGIMNDYFFEKSGNSVFRVSGPALELPPLVSHGTGCTLSAALAALTAAGVEKLERIRLARAFVLGSLSESVCLGENLAGMYPPEYDYAEEIILKKIKTGKAGGC